jgi:WD40 repeat protein
MRRFAVLIAALACVPALAQGNVTITSDTAPELVPFDSFGPGSARAVAFSPNSKLVAVATTRGVNLYETAAFGVEDALDGDPFPANAIAFYPDGSVLASTSAGYNVRAFDVLTGALVEDVYPDELAGSLSGIAFSPDGQTVALAPADALAVYEVESDTRLYQIVAHDHRITHVTYSPDGLVIATASLDGTAKLWDAATGAEVAALRGHADSLHTVAFSPDGATVLTASSDGTLRYWDAATGEELGTPYTHEGGGPMVAAYSPDGLRLAVADHHGDVRLLTAETGEEEALLGTHAGNVTALAFSPDGAWLVSASDGQVILWDLATLEHSGEATYQPSFGTLAVNDDGTLVAAGGEDGMIYTFDVGTGEHAIYAADAAPVTALGFGLDGQTLFVGSAASEIAAVNVAEATEQRRFGGTDAVIGLTLHPTQALMNAAMADGALRWWNSETGDEFGTAYTHDAPLTATAFSPDGVWMASADESGNIFVWGVESGDFAHTLDGASGAAVHDVAFSPDGEKVAAALADNRVLVWRLSQPEEPLLRLTDFFGPVNAVAFSPDSTALATANSDETVRVFDTATGDERFIDYQHDGPVYAVEFSPDGTRLYSAGDDGRVVMWGVP